MGLGIVTSIVAIGLERIGSDRRLKFHLLPLLLTLSMTIKKNAQHSWTIGNPAETTVFQISNASTLGAANFRGTKLRGVWGKRKKSLIWRAIEKGEIWEIHCKKMLKRRHCSPTSFQQILEKPGEVILEKNMLGKTPIS